MTRMVQVVVASDLTEAEEIQTMLYTAGIPSAVEHAVDEHPERDRRRAGSRPRVGV